jgi:hypothetical protein
MFYLNKKNICSLFSLCHISIQNWEFITVYPDRATFFPATALLPWYAQNLYQWLLTIWAGVLHSIFLGKKTLSYPDAVITRSVFVATKTQVYFLLTYITYHYIAVLMENKTNTVGSMNRFIQHQRLSLHGHRVIRPRAKILRWSSLSTQSICIITLPNVMYINQGTIAAYDVP